MTAVPIANEDRRLAHARAASVQTYARIAGVLFLISAVAGGFGEFFVPSQLIVSADAAATAKSIRPPFFCLWLSRDCPSPCGCS